MEIEKLIYEIKNFSKKIHTINLNCKNGYKFKEELSSNNGKNTYNLYLSYGKMNVEKISINTVHKQSNKVLVRLDLGNQRHVNPDGTVITSDHIHIYKDGYDEKFAYTLDSDEFKNLFPNPKDRCSLLKAYLEFIKVISVPQITEIHSF